MTIAEKIAERLIKTRKKQNLTAVELGAMTGISKARISHWETARRKPSIEDAELLSKVLKISPAYLLCLTDEEECESNRNFKIPIHEIIDGEIKLISESDINISSLLDVSSSENLIAIRLTDSSMEPTFRKGDVVIFTKSDKAQHGNLILIKTASGLFFRKLFIDTSNIALLQYCFKPENNEWPDISTSNKQAFSILGVMHDSLRVFI